VKDHLRDVVENCSQRHAYSLHIRNFRQIARRYTRRISGGENHFERYAKSVTTWYTFFSNEGISHRAEGAKKVSGSDKWSFVYYIYSDVFCERQVNDFNNNNFKVIKIILKWIPPMKTLSKLILNYIVIVDNIGVISDHDKTHILPILLFSTDVYVLMYIKLVIMMNIFVNIIISIRIMVVISNNSGNNPMLMRSFQWTRYLYNLSGFISVTYKNPILSLAAAHPRYGNFSITILQQIKQNLSWYLLRIYIYNKYWILILFYARKEKDDIFNLLKKYIELLYYYIIPRK